MLAVGIFIRMISTDVTCSSSAIRIPIVFHRVAISATSRKTSTSRIKRPRALSRLPEKDSTKLSGLDVNVNLIWGDAFPRTSLTSPKPYPLGASPLRGRPMFAYCPAKPYPLGASPLRETLIVRLLPAKPLRMR